ncbi:MAG: beta-mannanase [Phycisphaerae bacterium]
MNINVGNFIIDSQGYFSRDGQRIFPIGVNYWPGSCGVDMWQNWPVDEIKHDLDLIGRLGLNCLRFFLRWQDFEPQLGQYDVGAFDRLCQFMTWCSERDLLVQPTLFVGWMSGGLFWPAWKGSRNLFHDPLMIERAVAFAGKAAGMLGSFRKIVLAIDQGNELDCLPDSHESSCDQIVHWSQAVNEAIRKSFPGCLIISGNDHVQVKDDTAWRLDVNLGLDLVSMHAYPVPGWHNAIAFDGLTDPLCQSLLPFYTKFARAFGPVMVQEFGSIISYGTEAIDRYLQAVLPACLKVGANGFLWWCLRNIRATSYNYVRVPFERSLGLVDDQDHPKPALTAFLTFAASLKEGNIPDLSSHNKPSIGLYIPKSYYYRNVPENPGNLPNRLSSWLILANYILESLGHSPAMVRGGRQIDPEIKTILIPGSLIDEHEATALETWVASGGTLIWHGPSYTAWCGVQSQLTGAVPIDFRETSSVLAEAFSDRWSFKTFPGGTMVELEMKTATSVVYDQRQLPLVLVNRLGHGSVVTALPCVEQELVDAGGQRAVRDRWKRWYEGMLSIALE